MSKQRAAVPTHALAPLSKGAHGPDGRSLKYGGDCGTAVVVRSLELGAFALDTARASTRRPPENQPSCRSGLVVVRCD